MNFILSLLQPHLIGVRLWVILGTCLAFSLPVSSQGMVQKISDTEGGFTGVLIDQDFFGWSVETLGDLDGDGVGDLAVGSIGNDEGGNQTGAIWILFLNADGTVKNEQKISDVQGGLPGGVLAVEGHFGASLACIGDLDSDGVVDLAVGARWDGIDGPFRGAVWVLFLNSDGTVKAHQKISSSEGGFTGVLGDFDWFGQSVAALGDLDLDGVPDIAVGANNDDDGGDRTGTVWVLFLNSDGTVKAHQRISRTQGGGPPVGPNDEFGFSVGSLGDLDLDGVVDVAVGAWRDDDGGNNLGAVWVLFLNSNGTVKSHQKISATSGGFTGVPTLSFGKGVSLVEDLDSDGVQEMAVLSSGVAWLLFMNSDGTVKSYGELNPANFPGALSTTFPSSDVRTMGDLDGDGVPELAVGSSSDDDGGGNRGAVWILSTEFFAEPPHPPVASHQKISDTEGNFTGTLDNTDLFGFSVTSMGDLDQDGVGDAAVGAILDDDGGGSNGAVWVLFFNADGTVKAHQKISATQGGLFPALSGDRFGWDVAKLEDLDLDGVSDMIVGEPLADDGGTNRGAAWVLPLNMDGTVKFSQQKISDTSGGFTGILNDSDFFGGAVTSIGDLDQDGIEDVAVGAYGDDDGGLERGAVWILFLNADGTVRTHQKISATQGGFLGALSDGDQFGNSVAFLGDLDADGVQDLAVGVPLDDDGGDRRGAAWILFLNMDGTVKAHQKISDTQGGFTGDLDDQDRFGAVGAPGDLDHDGVADLLVGARTDDDGGSDRGALWLLFLQPDGTVKSHMKVSDTVGGFGGILSNGDEFGRSVAAIDLELDGCPELFVGADFDDDGGADRGAAWTLFLDMEAFSVEATAVVNNGQGINLDIQSAPPAILGAPWAATITVVDPSHPPTGVLVLLFNANSLPTGPRISLGGPVTELLIGGPLAQPCPPFQSYGAGTGVACPLVVIPNDCSLIGSPWCTQVAVGTPAAGFTLTNSVCGIVGTF